MSIKVTYSTKTFPVEGNNQVGKIIEIEFNSIEEAEAAPLPSGYVFAYIPVENGHHAYTETLGWEFNKK